MSNTVCISKAQWDQTRELLEKRRVEINALVDIGIGQNETIYARDEQLAAQRRTIATLRARLQNRKGRYWSRGQQSDSWNYEWRNRYHVFKEDDYAISEDMNYNVHQRKRILRKESARRITAIRNFGALP